MDILKPVDAEELKQIQQQPYEERDLSVRAMVQFLVIIFFTIIGSLIIGWFIYQWVLPKEEPNLPSVRKEALERQLPPEPRVQGFPMRDWEEFVAQENEKTKNLPQAKERILQQGLPRSGVMNNANQTM
ncbi:MAG: hypothetical protein SNJ72_01510 [Fimbriimonadales bacterium]